MSFFQQQKFKKAWEATEAALKRGDHEAVVQHCLVACEVAPSKDSPGAWAAFSTMFIALASGKAPFSTELVETLRTKFLENEEELVIYRAHAAYLLATQCLSVGNGAEAVAYVQRMVSLCESATQQERQQTFYVCIPFFSDRQTDASQPLSPESKLVGKLLDELKVQADSLQSLRQEYRSCHEAFDAAAAADARDDESALVHHTLTACQAFPTELKDSPERWSLFSPLYGMLVSEAVPFSEHLIETLRTKFMDNEEEPVMYRAHAADLLAFHYMKSGHSAGNDAVPYCQRVLSLCESATQQERQQVLQVTYPDLTGDLASPRTKPAGDMLDSLKENANGFIHERHDRLRDFFMESGLAEGQRETVEEMMQVVENDFSALPEIDDLMAGPPPVTSATIDQVKSLPERDVVVFLHSDITAEDIASERQAGFGPCQIAGVRGTCRAFIVDVDNYRAGKHKKVFDQLAVTFCFDTEETRTKSLISLYVKSCLSPFHLSPRVQSPARPRRVLLLPLDANDSRLHSFLEMMGCSEIDVLEPGLIELFRRTWKDVLASANKHRFDKDENPYLYDHAMLIFCAHCKIVGPKLQRCPCGSAYYCSKKCQKAEWSEHKAEHQAQMARKNQRSRKTS